MKCSVCNHDMKPLWSSVYCANPNCNNNPDFKRLIEWQAGMQIPANGVFRYVSTDVKDSDQWFTHETQPGFMIITADRTH